MNTYTFYFLFFVYNIINCYRYEPFKIWKARYNYFEQLFKQNNSPQNLKLSYSHKTGFYCKSRKDINNGDLVFSIPANHIVSLFDDYPFKASLYNLLSELDFEGIGKLNNNLLANFLLSLRVLFEIKANHTESFIQLKKIESKFNKNKKDNINNEYTDVSFTKYRNYIKYKNENDHLYTYYSMLPLQYMYSQTAFYNKGDEDYSKSAHIKPLTKLIDQVYLTIADRVENFEKESIKNSQQKLDENTNKKDNTMNASLENKLNQYIDLFSSIKNWFNKDNLNLFKSAYAFVSSRSFKHDLNEYIVLPELSSKENDELNLLISKDIVEVPFLIPSIDLCNHYHPEVKDSNTIKNDKTNTNSLNSRYSNKSQINKKEQANEHNSKLAKLKMIKITSSKGKPDQLSHYSIFALENYNKGEEFNFSYSKLLSNDYLLLNYGFIVKDNPFQEYVFNFQFVDENKALYNELYKHNFNVEKIRFLNKNKINEQNYNDTSNSNVMSIDFHLKKDIINEELLDFIYIYLSHSKLLENPSSQNDSHKTDKKNNYYKGKSNNSPKTDIPTDYKNSIKILIVYYRSIEKNIRSIFDSRLSIKSTNSTFLLNEIYDNIKEIDNLQDKLDNLIEEKDNKEAYTNMDFLIKTNNILLFHSENVKILESHKKIVIENILNLYSNFLLNGKLTYSTKSRYLN